MAKRGSHDMGGEAAGSVDRHEHAPTMTERRIDAMMQLLRNNPRSFWVTDENRRTIESLTPETYKSSSYYEKWTLAMRGLLIEKGVLTEVELAKRLSEVKARHGAGNTTDVKPKAKAAARRARRSKPKPTAKPKAKSARSKSR